MEYACAEVGSGHAVLDICQRCMQLLYRGCDARCSDIGILSAC